MRGEDLLTTGQAATALGVSINTIKAWARTGRLEAFRLPSGHHRIPRGEIDRLRAEGASPAVRRARWREVDRWRRERPAEQDGALEDVLDWLRLMLETAEAQGPIPDPTPEETAARVRAMHRALARVPVGA